MLLLVILAPLTVAKQSPLRVEVTALVLVSTKEELVAEQRATGLPYSQEAGAILSLTSLPETQQEHCFATVLL
jgi:hypothetical protein